MNTLRESRHDIVVIGSGPAGQKAAIHGARAGKKVLLVDREQAAGGACVRHGTIPSKTLREAAMALSNFRRRTGQVFDVTIPEEVQVMSLLTRLQQVVRAHEGYMAEQLEKSGVERLHGHARFVSPHVVEVQEVDGSLRRLSAGLFVLATGSHPRHPPEVPIDHEHVLDSDSILSLLYLPVSLTVLGAGIVACEYASIFASLGVKVVIVDRAERPMSFLDGELCQRFRRSFEEAGGVYLGGRVLKNVEWDGLSAVVTTLESGEQVCTEKMLVALGRVASVKGLGLEHAGLAPDARGLLPVDKDCRTPVPHIYAVGDVSGPPSLASAAMEQGRRAICHALGMDSGVPAEMIPLGIYTIPEMSSVGLSEAQAIERHGGALVGRASFSELARGQIAAIPDGLLKLVADPGGRRLLGVQILGEGAAELIHVGQMALLAGFGIDVFVENIFNFPTLAEGYRVAALDIAMRRPS